VKLVLVKLVPDGVIVYNFTESIHWIWFPLEPEFDLLQAAVTIKLMIARVFGFIFRD
jgi:hypothetical protein